MRYVDGYVPILGFGKSNLGLGRSNLGSILDRSFIIHSYANFRFKRNSVWLSLVSESSWWYWGSRGLDKQLPQAISGPWTYVWPCGINYTPWYRQYQGFVFERRVLPFQKCGRENQPQWPWSVLYVSIHHNRLWGRSPVSSVSALYPWNAEENKYLASNWYWNIYFRNQKSNLQM